LDNPKEKARGGKGVFVFTIGQVKKKPDHRHRGKTLKFKNVPAGATALVKLVQHTENRRGRRKDQM